MSNETPTDALRLVPVEPTREQELAMQRALLKDYPRVFEGEAYVNGKMLDAIYSAAIAAAPASPLPGGGNILWMMHVRGPDDIYPAPDYETAVAWCDYVNDVLAKRLPDVMMKAVPAVYPRTREQHAAGLPDAMKGWTLPAAPTGDA